MPVRKAATLLLLLVLAAGSTSVLADVPEWFSLYGKDNGDGSYQISIVPSLNTDDAILVYAKPGNRLVVAIIDSTFKTTPAGQALQQRIDAENPEVYAETDLPGTTGNFIIASSVLDGQTGIRVQIWGEYQGQTLADATLQDGSVSMSSFGTESLVIGIDPGTGDLQTRTCCRCGKAKKNCGCKDCGADFTCDCINCSLTCN